MKRLNVVLLGAMTTTLFCGCIDKDLYDPDYKKENFEAHWNKQFGDVDPNQDWNMATLLKANIDLSSYGGGAIAKIYTANPVSGGQLIGVASQSTTLAMNVVKGSKYVFATIEQNGSVLSNGYVPIQNGEIHIGGFSRSTREANDVKLGEEYVIEGQTSRDSDSDYTYTLEEARKVGDVHHWVQVYDANGNPIKESDGCYRLVNINGDTWHDYYPNHENSKYANDYNYPGKYNCSESSDKFPHRLHVSAPQKYQRLTDVETFNNISWKVDDYYALFGTNGFFGEYSNNKQKYNGQFVPDVTFTVTGEVTLDYMFGGTQNQNVFGYYYWQDGEDPIAATRYVLIADAQPHTNLSYTLNGVTKPLDGDMSLASWMSSYDVEAQSYGEYSYAKVYKDAIITGTSYKVPYFDANGNPTYTFPEGTHIAFFLVVKGCEQGDNAKMENWLNLTNMSVQDHNKSIGRVDDTGEGEIDAIAFKYGNQVFLGFEDRGGDDDMNDIVFFVNGAKPDDENIPVLVPPTQKTYPQWIIACEDLGSTDDYDFNDCVFGVTHVAGTTEATVQALAAGGVYGIDVYYQSTLLFEIHQALGTSAKEEGSYPMLNTSGTVSPGNTVTITVPADFTLSYDSTNGDNMGGFSLQVHSKETTEIITSPKIGTAPQMLLLPGTWAWPKERIDIRDAYPNFENWNSDTDAIGWCDSPVTDKVVSW